MRQFGLIGYPLSHSFSKKYFTEKFEKERRDNCIYENYPISDVSELAGLIHSNASLEGINVTIPYKEKVIPYLTWQSDVVKEVKACNCIKIENGKLAGYNTDVIGFERTLGLTATTSHKEALILGTGGAAKAVAYVMKKLGIHYRYVSRTATNDILSYNNITPDLLAGCTLIINTTPLGMYPETASYPPLPYHAISSHHYLFDLVYNPATTVFLQKGGEQGAEIKNGQDMLIIQAEESWKIWNSITG